jgi:hypothetical protein
MKKLQQLQGVGEILSRRFVEAGYDTFAKVAAAGEEGLRKIPGVNPRLLGAIVAQAGSLAGNTSDRRAKLTEESKRRAVSMKEQVQGIALSVRDRFKDETGGKTGKKVAKAITKMITTLEKVEGRLETRVKKAGKGLVKAERQLEGLTASGLKKVGKGLKKARKSLEKVVA